VNCIIEIPDVTEENSMNKRVLTAALLASFGIIGSGVSCVPKDQDSGSLPGPGYSHTTLPSSSSQENCRSGAAHGGEPDVPEDIQQLIAALDSEDPSVRIEAARSLYKCADRAAPAIPALLNHLSDEGAIYEFELRFTVAEEATIALVAIGEAALAPAVQRLQGGDSGMRTGAARLLGRIGGSNAVPPLIVALRDPVPDVRQAAVDALQSKNDARAVKPLMELARSDTSKPVLYEIPWSIRDTEGDHLEEMLSLMELGKPTLRRAVVLCLSQGRSDPRLVAPLLKVFRDQRSQFVESYASLFRQIYRSGGVEEVADVVRSDEYPASARRWALAAMKGDALEPELALLSLPDRDRDLRLLAAARLSDLRPSGMADRVFEILDELDDEAHLETVRELAAYLGFTKDSRATIPLVAALDYTANKQSGYSMMPRSMIVVFGELNDPRAVDRLLEKTNDPSRNVRLAAIHALLQIDDPRVKKLFRFDPDASDSPLRKELPALIREIERKEQAWKLDSR
jgi:HEAT repeat protein